MTVNEEKDFILRAQAGDAAAEDVLLKKYAGLVKSIARSYFIIGADRDREDLAQVGMIALMRAIRTFTFDGKATFKTYATHCVRNTVIDEVRKNNVDPPLPIEDVGDIDDGTPSPDFLLDAIYSILNETERQVLELYLEALSYDEISKRLGLEKKKVDNTIYSAKRKIKKLLNTDK